MSFKKILITALVLASCGPSKKENVSELEPVDTVQSVSPVVPDTLVVEGTEEESNFEDVFKLDNYLVKGGVTEKDLHQISESVALLISPTHEQIEEMKKEYGEEDFYTVADDNSYYQGTAIGMIDSLGVKMIGDKSRFIRFEGRDGKSVWTLDIRKKGAPPWNLIFFHTDKSPEIISTVDIDSEKIKAYFDL